MRRRDMLKAAGASLAALAAPRIGRAERANKLVFVPAVNLNVLDPIVTGIRSTRNHAYLVFDTLYGLDTNWKAQPQMVEGHQVEEDGLTWILTLREGLRFHDKEPVLARPCSGPPGSPCAGCRASWSSGERLRRCASLRRSRSSGSPGV